MFACLLTIATSAKYNHMIFTISCGTMFAAGGRKFSNFDASISLKMHSLKQFLLPYNICLLLELISTGETLFDCINRFSGNRSRNLQTQR